MGSAPRVRWIGLGLHGELPVERFLLPGVWCLHLFRDALDLRVNGERVAVVPGTATLIAPHCSIEFHFPRRVRHLHAFAHFSTEGAATDGAGEVRPFPAVQDVGAAFEVHFAALSEAVGFWSSGSARAGARLWELLWNLSAPTDEASREKTLMARAKERIELRLSEPIVVAALARELDVSHNHLTRRFRAETGQTVVEFIRARRVERALYLLRGTTLPIKAIAGSSGLGDFHLLNKTLRRETGKSPREWRAGG